MSGAHIIVQKLFNTQQQTAVGIGHFIQALLNFIRPGGNNYPIIVEHMNKEGTTKTVMFGRQTLTVNFDDAMRTLKSDLGIETGYYTTHTATITGISFYNEDGSIQETPAQFSRSSWAQLVPYVHKIFIRSNT